MRKLYFTGLLGVLALVLASPGAADPVQKQDRLNASRACVALKASLGGTLFAQTYGTNVSRSNAMGMCASKWTREAHAARHAAETACRAEAADPNFAATHGGKTFTQFYGTGRQGKNALANCIRLKNAAALKVQQKATENAAQRCRAERRTLGTAAFAQKYGTNRNDRNAFGKCVSQLSATKVYRVALSQLNGSGVSGTAKLTLKANQLTVRVEASGLEANQTHMQHLHGLADAQQNATCPSASADTNTDGLISFAEGLPFYGGVLLALTPYPTTTNGDVSYEATFTVDPAALGPLENRTLVLHGKTVGGAYDASLPVACGEITK